MKFEIPLWQHIEAAIDVDEVGIETGRCNSYVLKTLYQPIFRKAAKDLVPWGVCGAVPPYRNGRPASREALMSDSPDRISFMEGLSRVLDLRNHRNIGIEGLALLFSFDPEAISNAPDAAGQVDSLIRLLEEVEIAPELLVCEIAETVEEYAVEELVAALRQRSVRMVVGQSGAEASFLSRLRLIDPEFVKLDGGWFRRIAGVPMASRLLASLVDALQREGREVVISGIETPAQFRAALDAGADFLQGDLLRPAKLAGALFNTESLEISSLLASSDKIVPLFRSGRSG